MAVLLPTPHQEKEHQEKSRREQEKPRVEPGPDGGSFPCAVCSEGHREGKAPFRQKRSGKKWEGGEGNWGILMHRERGGELCTLLLPHSLHI